MVGTGEIFGGVMVLTRTYRFLGSLLLGVILIGAIVTQVTNGDPFAEVVAAPIAMALVAMVAIGSSPIGFSDLVAPPRSQRKS